MIERHASMARLTDAELMALVQRDDGHAFAEVVVRHDSPAHRLAQAICQDPVGADAAVHEAFVDAWAGRRTYQADRGAVLPWLMSIVRHRALAVARDDASRARHTAPAEALADLEGEDDVAVGVIAAEDARRLASLLDRLPAAQREVVVLAFYGQLSHREIAERLGLPAGTVKGRMRLGLDKLRDGLSG